jgi:sulfite reductase (ferredoxin)
MQVPPYEKDPSYYSDWGDPREFSMGDIGMGECAGAVVSLLAFELQAAERMCFEGQLALEAKDYAKADERAYRAMLQAARALVKEQWLDVPEKPDTVIQEFRTRFVDTKLFWDRFAGGKFSQFLFGRHEQPPAEHTSERAHKLVEEAQLFIEAAHACADKMLEQKTAAKAPPAAKK